MDTATYDGYPLVERLKRSRRRGASILNVAIGTCFVTFTAVCVLYWWGPLRYAPNWLMISCLASPVLLVWLSSHLAPRDVVRQVVEVQNVRGTAAVWALIDVLEHQGHDVRSAAAQVLIIRLSELKLDEAVELTPERANTLSRLLIQCYVLGRAPFDIHLAKIIMEMLDVAGSTGRVSVLTRLASAEPSGPNQLAIRDVAQLWLNSLRRKEADTSSARLLLRSGNAPDYSAELLRIPNNRSTNAEDLLRPAGD